MSTKTIEMTVRQGHSVVNFRETVNDDCNWTALAYIFHRFLLAQGYNLDDEAVSADVESYVRATDIPEEEQW